MGREAHNDECQKLYSRTPLVCSHQQEGNEGSLRRREVCTTLWLQHLKERLPARRMPRWEHDIIMDFKENG